MSILNEERYERKSNDTHPESKYCFALDENRVKLRLRISAGDIPDRICAVYGGKYDFAVERKSVAMKREREDALYAYYTVTLNLDDKRLVYVFEIEETAKLATSPRTDLRIHTISSSAITTVSSMPTSTAVTYCAPWSG